MTRKVLALILALAMLIPTVAMGEAADKYGKYEEPITLTFLTKDEKSTEVQYNADNPDRKSAHENAWITAYKDYLNIEIKREIAEDSTALNARLNTGMATGDLPDVMIVPKDMFYVLAENGVLQDLSGAYENYANKNLLQVGVDAWNGVLETGMWEGELLGFPMMPNSFNSTQVLWIRQDWLDKVGMEAPKTIDELIAVGKAFMDAKLGGDNAYAWGSASDPFSPIFAAYGSVYKERGDVWVETADGKYVYGGVNVEPNKAALLAMQEMYKAGLLSKDIAVSDGKVLAEDVANDRVGMIFGEGWLGATTIKTSNVNNENADWIAVRIPTLTGEDVDQWTNATIGSFIVVNSECKNPKAIFKMLELELNIYYAATPEESAKLYLCEDGYAIWNFRIFRNWTYPTQDFMRAEECIAGKAAGLTEVTPFSNANYQRMLQGLNNQRDQVGFARVMLQAYPVIDALNKAGHLVPEYAGPTTENMTLYRNNINQALASAMYKVVLGEDISVYEKAVETWYASGGQAITDEVNAYYAANK